MSSILSFAMPARWGNAGPMGNTIFASVTAALVEPYMQMPRRPRGAADDQRARIVRIQAELRQAVEQDIHCLRHLDTGEVLAETDVRARTEAKMSAPQRPGQVAAHY